MWIVAPLERSEDGGRLTFVDHEAISLYAHEASAREAVEKGLRSGYPLVGLFAAEGIYDADLTLRKLES